MSAGRACAETVVVFSRDAISPLCVVVFSLWRTRRGADHAQSQRATPLVSFFLPETRFTPFLGAVHSLTCSHWPFLFAPLFSCEMPILQWFHVNNPLPWQPPIKHQLTNFRSSLESPSLINRPKTWKKGQVDVWGLGVFFLSSLFSSTTPNFIPTQNSVSSHMASRNKDRRNVNNQLWFLFFVFAVLHDNESYGKPYFRNIFQQLDSNKQTYPQKRRPKTWIFSHFLFVPCLHVCHSYSWLQSW